MFIIDIIVVCQIKWIWHTFGIPLKKGNPESGGGEQKES